MQGQDERIERDRSHLHFKLLESAVSSNNELNLLLSAMIHMENSCVHVLNP